MRTWLDAGRRHLDAWRLTFGAVGLTAAIVAALLAFGQIDVAPATGGHGDSPAEAGWKAAAHPGRQVFAGVTIEKVPDLRQNSFYGYVAHVAYEFVIEPGDPLFMPLINGDVSGDDLVTWVARGTGRAETDPVTVQRVKGGPARATVTTTLRHGSDGDADPTEMTGTFELERPPGVDGTGQAAAAAERRILTVHSDSASIVGVTGGDVTEQDASQVGFDGPPTGISVTVHEKNPDPRFLSGPPHGPFEALDITTLGYALLAMIVLLGPWLAILLALWRRRNPTWWIGAQAVAVTLLLWLLLGLWVNPARWHWGELGVAAAAILLAVRGLQRRGSSVTDPALGRRLLAASGLALGAVVAACVLQRDDLVADPDSLTFAVMLAVAVAALFVAWRRDAKLTGVALGLFAGLVTVASSIMATGAFVHLGPAFAAAAAALGLACVLVADAGLLAPRVAGHRSTIRTASYVVGLLLFVPLVRALIGIDQVMPFGATVDAATAAILIFDVALLFTFGVVLYRNAAHTIVVGSRTLWALALAVLLVVATDRGRLVQFNALATAVLVVSWWGLAPRSGIGNARKLVAVDAGTHRLLMAAETQRRVAEQCAHETYRSAPALVRGGRSLDNYQQLQQEMDDAAETTATASVNHIPVEDALATTGAATPAESARAAVVCALPVAVPIVLYEWWTLLSSDLATVVNATPPQLVLLVAHTARWLVYAGLFGLFYPLLRGRTPISTAGTLILLVLPAELLSVLSSINPSATDGIGITTLPQMFLALAIRAGQVVVLGLFLGLAWERRLVQRGGQRWSRLRNARSLHALAAPVGTVLVAVATTFGTAFASAAVAGLLSTGSSPPAPAPPPTTVTDPP